MAINANAIIYNTAKIGQPPEHRGYDGTSFGVVIGSGCVVRDFVTVDSGMLAPTQIGEDTWLLAKSHVGHDAVLGKHVTVCTGAIIGGHAVIGDYCYIGLNAVMHQRAVLLPYSIIGACGFYKPKETAVPGLIWAGVPARPIGVNLVGLERHVEDPIVRACLIQQAADYLACTTSH